MIVMSVRNTRDVAKWVNAYQNNHKPRSKIKESLFKATLKPEGGLITIDGNLKVERSPRIPIDFGELIRSEMDRSATATQSPFFRVPAGRLFGDVGTTMSDPERPIYVGRGGDGWGKTAMQHNEPTRPTEPLVGTILPPGLSWNIQFRCYQASCNKCHQLSPVNDPSFFDNRYHKCDPCMKNVKTA